MGEGDWLADRFQEHRARLRAVAYRMLGSPGEADDAVQEAWLRFSRTDTSAVENLGSWLTTVVSRVCLNMLEARRLRPESPFGEEVPEPAADPAADPEYEALLADSVGLALLVVLRDHGELSDPVGVHRVQDVRNPFGVDDGRLHGRSDPERRHHRIGSGQCFVQDIAVEHICCGADHARAAAGQGLGVTCERQHIGPSR